MGTPTSTPTRPQNLGTPIQLQKVWARITESTFPVLTNTNAAKKPKSEVYVNWKSERRMAGTTGVCGWVRRNS